MLCFGNGHLNFGDILVDGGTAARVGEINLAARANGLKTVCFYPPAQRSVGFADGIIVTLMDC